MSLQRVKAYPPTRGNFSVSARFFLLRSIFRNHAGTGVEGTSVKGTSTHERGRTWSPPLYTKDLFASGSVARDDLVKGRVRHRRGVHLRRAFHHVHQGFQHCWIGAAVIGVCVLFVVPHTGAHRGRAVLGRRTPSRPGSLAVSAARECYRSLENELEIQGWLS
jgi:hypothetical protein